MFDSGFVIIYQGKDGWLFDLSRQRGDIKTADDKKT